MESRLANDNNGPMRAKPQLSAEDTVMVHTALQGVRHPSDPQSSADVKDALQRLCLKAKEANWTPEGLLIAFKEALYTLPTVERVPRGPDRDEFVARLVSLCIEAYFGTPTPKKTSGDR